MKKFLKLAMTGPIRKLVAGSMIISSTSAGTFTTPSQDRYVWSEIRRELESNSAAIEFQDLKEVLDLYQTEQIDLETAIRLSYGRTDNRDALDEFWTDFLASADGGISFERFIALRSDTLSDTLTLTDEELLGSWLWKAQGANDYDCVASGGSGNCGNGGGLGGGNGTGNEGNGNGNNP